MYSSLITVGNSRLKKVLLSRKVFRLRFTIENPSLVEKCKEERHLRPQTKHCFSRGLSMKTVIRKVRVRENRDAGRPSTGNNDENFKVTTTSY